METIQTGYMVLSRKDIRKMLKGMLRKDSICTVSYHFELVKDSRGENQLRKITFQDAKTCKQVTIF